MTGGVYDDGDPGPAPGARPLCPVCPSDAPRSLDVIDKPPGYWCRTCDTFFDPHPPRADHPRMERMRRLLAEANQPRQETA